MKNFKTVVFLTEDPGTYSRLSPLLAARGMAARITNEIGDETEVRQQDPPMTAIVLDVSAQQRDHLNHETLRAIQGIKNEFPDLGLLLVTTQSAMRTPPDFLSSLSAGVDDFIVKPFSEIELLTRLDALDVRKNLGRSSLEHGGLKMDLSARRVAFEGQNISLTPTEFRILEILLKHSGHVVTRRMLCESLWDPKWEGVTNVIEVHMNRLRTKLTNAGSPKLIQTVRGSGYMIKEIVAADPPPPALAVNSKLESSLN